MARRDHHQQHHRQQCGGVGRCGNLLAGCVEGEHHQQHHRPQRQPRHVGRADQQHRDAPVQRPSGELHERRWYGIVPAVCRGDEYAELHAADHNLHWDRHARLPGGTLRLSGVLESVPVW